MNKFSITVIATAVALAFNTGALAAQAISKEAYKSGQDKIASEYKSAKAACDSLKANAKDVCVAEAQGKQKIAKAELEADYKPTDKSRYNVNLAKAEAEYALAKEKCDDKAGADKSACVKEAKAVESRAKADAKAVTTPAVASKPARTTAAPETSRPAKATAAPETSRPAKTTAAPATSKQQSAGAYVDDSVITGKVKLAVLEEATLKSAEINVETRKGVVQLTGFVSSRAAIDKAVEVARRVEGVKSVKNDMIVKGQ